MGTSDARILVVVDDPDTRASVHQLLAAHYRVEAVPDGQAALEAIGQQAPDLVLTAGTMPGLDGLGLLREIRSKTCTSGIPVVLLSAHDEDEWRIEGIRAGADDYLTTPFSARELLARVGVHLTRSRLRDEAACRDIAERKQLEENLRELEASLVDVERLAHLGRWERDLRSGQSYWSDEVYRILGRTPGSCLPSREAFLEAVVPEDRERAEAAASATASDGVTRWVEFRIMTAQGAVRWIDGTVELVRDSGRDPARINGTVQDITERKRADDALRESEARFRTMADCAPAMLWVADKEGNSQFVNRAYCDFFGKSLEEVEGSGWRPLLHPDDAAAYIEAFLTAMRERTPFYALTRAQRHDGDWRWLESYGALRFTPSGEFLGVVGTTLDITRRKQAEELAARAAEFERLNAQAQLAKEAAEGANRAKSTFLANMSHELRTPLNAVLGYAQILQRDPALSASAANGLETIRRGGEQLLTLINEVLDLARIEAGKIELYPDAVSLASVLRTVTDIVRVNALEKGLRFDVDDAADLPAFVHADEKRLGQVLLNLLSNAVKFTDRGGVQLRTRCLGLGDAKVRVCFEVVDSGIGIAEEQQATIFLPFEQVGDVQRRFGGSGLGLAISRQLVRLMGSDIRVESRLGQGSRFWFDVDLPIAHAPPPADTTGQQIITGYLGPRRKMLVVDDVAGNRAIMVDFLAPLGFEVIEADNGEKGLELAAAMAPDLIVMDSVMPVMGGGEATRRLRQRPEHRDVPIIVVSASATLADQQDSLVNGANAFLPKPVDLGRLLVEIGALLKLTWLGDARAAASTTGDASPALVVPPAEEIDVLYQLAKLGNMQRIRMHADDLEALDDAYRPFAQRLRRLADGFQSRAILEFVSRFR